MRLTNRKILLGVCGCIAAYKSAYLVRLLRQEGAEVRVMVTRSAGEFVAPLTFETLTDHPVYSEMFPKDRYFGTHHIDLAEWADLIVVAPASGNMIGKIASGVADDFVSTVVMASQSPVMISPSMNTHMYENPIMQANLRKLKDLGYRFVEPTVGELACKTYGVGRLPDPQDIVTVITSHFGGQPDLSGLKVLISAGPTVEYLDPVRYISNPSSGKMGYALAERARARGAEVTLVSGPVALEAPAGVTKIDVESGSQMLQALKAHFDKCDMLLMAAAVGDYGPETVSEHKIKKSAQPIQLKLVPKADILLELSRDKSAQVMVGFALETEDIGANASEKLNRKKLDMIVVNEHKVTGAAFKSDTNQVMIIEADGNSSELPMMTKLELADKILDNALKISIKSKHNG